MENLINGRCGWCGNDELYVKYHDEEWGRLVTDDKALFEFLVLESAQAGLSWITILRKRENYRKAFHNFDVEKVAGMTAEDIERLMQFDGIVKNRLKITSAITNARLFMDIQKEFGSFYNYTLSFFPDNKPIVNNPESLSEIPVSSPESDAMSKDMKKRGFKFFGTTICYAHLQASGFVNDHLVGCFCREVAVSKV
ncbi:DNA-3-methyladenine glycosylase I [Bacteroides sp. UBA939]|uniref:DNA-3-methyladenine glycosylase I n=1 Tax=Bacteroides sp. UBA939 TaxID=1946092 RepID=UPI0025C34C61|nr:DNA-3-methyladenine glycosylase I [Bacteroides sp. UBA939]